jgi:macrodomain Ter protein organizer (MatP/YcbG family)
VTGVSRSWAAQGLIPYPLRRQIRYVCFRDKLEAVADRGYYNSTEIKACDDAGRCGDVAEANDIGAKSDGRFGKQDFVYNAAEDVYRCPAGEKLAYRMTTEQDGKMMRRYWTNACPNCLLKSKCTTGNERRILRWEHEHVLEAAQKRLDENPQAMRARRETVEHPFGTLKMRMGATHFLMKRLPKVATEMALHVLAYNLTRVMNIVGVKPLLVAIRA